MNHFEFERLFKLGNYVVIVELKKSLYTVYNWVFPFSSAAFQYCQREICIVVNVCI